MIRETPLPGAVYQAVPGFEDHLERELDDAWPGAQREWWGILSRPTPAPGADLPGAGPRDAGLQSAGPRDEGPQSAGPPGARQPVFWAANVWLRPFLLEFDSISEAAGVLREKQRNWAAVLHTAFRRAALITEKLPPLREKKRQFPWLLPTAPMGAWTLLDAHTLAGSALCTSPFPGGRVEFEEDREGPPSRAYLKLWEALVRARRWPLPGERCLDAGASPGGWSWALADLGAEVIAVDRAPLDGRILERRLLGGGPQVRFIKHDAFTLRPGEIGAVDWLFCDVVSYPGRLYRWVEEWLASGLARNFVCTIKMQGRADGEAADPGRPSWEEGLAAAREFAAIPGSSVLHLHHNRHELVWMKTG